MEFGCWPKIMSTPAGEAVSAPAPTAADPLPPLSRQRTPGGREPGSKPDSLGPDWISHKPTGKGPRGHPVPLQVLRINMLQLQSVDQMAQTFTARFFIQLSIPHGAHDDDLTRNLDAADMSAEPAFASDTLRPSANWFLHQIDFPTSLDYTVITRKVVRMSDDLHLVLKVAGTFFEPLELGDFPFDVQRLTTNIAVNVAAEGIVPVQFHTPHQKTALAVNIETFALSNLWRLYPHVALRHTIVTPMPDTTYPAVSVSVLVKRRPGFVLINVFTPMLVLTFLILMQFFLPPDQTQAGVRITYTCTILLTSATYKLFVTTSLPAIAYTTLCDKYLLACFFLQAFVVAEGAVMGAVQGESNSYGELDRTLPWKTSVADFVIFVCCAALFVLMHVWFIFFTGRSLRVKLQSEFAFFQQTIVARSSSSASPGGPKEEDTSFSTYRRDRRPSSPTISALGDRGGRADDDTAGKEALTVKVKEVSFKRDGRSRQSSDEGAQESWREWSILKTASRLATGNGSAPAGTEKHMATEDPDSFTNYRREMSRHRSDPGRQVMDA